MQWRGVTNDPARENLNKLDRDILVLQDVIGLYRWGKTPPPKGKLAELQEYFGWWEVLVHHKRERETGVAKKNEQTTWRGFIDVKMTDAEKETFSQWDVHDQDLFLLLGDAVVAGHKLSMTFNKQNETYVCSFTGNDGTGKHEGYTLSAYANDWYIALRVLLFKHVALLQCDWTLAKERPTEGIG